MAFHKPKMYLDPSVFIYYFSGDEDKRRMRDITRRFFENEAPGQRYELVSSELVLRALGNGFSSSNVEFAKSLPVIYLPVSDEVRRLAQKLVVEGLIPKSNPEIPLHLAFALFHRVKYIVSWDFQHMIKPKTKKAVKIKSLQEGEMEIKIITPEAVVISGDDV
ncbi:MAG: hypothetical protein K6U80_09205 [Firmicutes bacterium]|nr:hypothetical protein [Bacillota bacterium]